MSREDKGRGRIEGKQINGKELETVFEEQWMSNM